MSKTTTEFKLSAKLSEFKQYELKDKMSSHCHLQLRTLINRTMSYINI